MDEYSQIVLPNLFGKFARPFHNSVVATFITQELTGQKLTVHDENQMLNLVYVDSVIERVFKWLEVGGGPISSDFSDCMYEISVGTLAALVKAAVASIERLDFVGETSDGLFANLLSTVASEMGCFMPIQSPVYADFRGSFRELLRLNKVGQVSLLTVEPGESRGKHWHNSKFEIFFVLDGVCLFKDLRSGTEKVLFHGTEDFCLSRPGSVHEIQNVGDVKALILVWANECYRVDKADTFL